MVTTDSVAFKLTLVLGDCVDKRAYTHREATNPLLAALLHSRETHDTLCSPLLYSTRHTRGTALCRADDASFCLAIDDGTRSAFPSRIKKTLHKSMSAYYLRGDLRGAFKF